MRISLSLCVRVGSIGRLITFLAFLHAAVARECRAPRGKAVFLSARKWRASVCGELSIGPCTLSSVRAYPSTSASESEYRC
uniref:Putative secreted protein n=1 Tax=Ixodes ricinus TaxID=34613 RepID=A0A6B0TWC7_IXORI